VADVFFQGVGINEYVVYVDYEELVDDISENAIHQPLKSRGSIAEAKWHDSPFIKTIACSERGLVLITLLDADLVVPTLQINLGEVLGSLSLIQ